MRSSGPDQVIGGQDACSADGPPACKPSRRPRTSSKHKYVVTFGYSSPKAAFVPSIVDRDASARALGLALDQNFGAHGSQICPVPPPDSCSSTCVSAACAKGLPLHDHCERARIRRLLQRASTVVTGTEHTVHKSSAPSRLVVRGHRRTRVDGERSLLVPLFLRDHVLHLLDDLVVLLGPFADLPDEHAAGHRRISHRRVTARSSAPQLA